MMRKKIAIYYAGFLRYGGVLTHVRTLEQELINTGWNVKVYTLDSLPVLLRYIPHLVEKLINAFNRPLGYFYKDRLTSIFYRILFNNNVDLRVFEDIYIAWNSKIPSVTYLHAFWSDNLQSFYVNEKQLKKLKLKEVEIIYKINHSIVTVSYPYLQYINNFHFNHSLSKKIEVIELGVDQNSFNKIKKINEKSIIFVGSIEARKNIIFLLEIFKKLYLENNKFKLTIIGDGPDLNKVTEFVKTNNLKVNLMGKLKHKEVISELFNHDIYLHTSVKESFSYSLLEAKLAGLTTCAFANLQVPEEFIDIPVESFNVDEWCSAIKNGATVKKNFNRSKFTVERMSLLTIRMAK
jgi:glycosyltransferase involved in cell wall biosynthesis